jgi:Secretion system C-terminal sorting domain/Pregnancy-associated plasma protein-A
VKVIIIFICWCFVLNTNAQRCGTTEYIQQYGSAFTSVAASRNAGTDGRDTLQNEVIVIPVVVHVLYHNSIQNISDEQVLSQLTVLNNDYRRLNADTVNTPGPFKKMAADTRIVFCLAKVDPNGRYTPGIIHKYTKEELFLSDDEMKFSSGGGDDAWDSKKYLNIWVCSLFGRTLGYGVLPGGAANRDGVVIQYAVFGTTGAVTAPFDKGRTTTHEVGHWLGLRHLWGDVLCGDDGIADTPPQQASNSNCPSFPHTSSCSDNSYGDMFMDYMDFTDDACMNMFTQGQKSEMRSMFALGGPRNSFLNSSVCDSSLAQGGPLPEDSITSNSDISVYPNPFSYQVTISYKNKVDIPGKTAKIYDVTGKLFSVQILTSQKTSIALNNLPNGMYFLKIEGGNNPAVFKLIKQP